MKPSAFAYAAPETLDEALTLLAEHGTEASVLAGGQSLVPMLNLRLARPSILVDVNSVPGLDGLHVNGGVELGALARQQVVLRSPELGTAVPLLAQALAHVGHVASRWRGTIGGSVAHADPAAELPAVVLALDGAMTVSSVRGARTIGATDFFRGPFTTALEPDELLTGIELPPAAPRDRFGVHEVTRRHGDFALAGAVCALRVTGDTVEKAALALFGVAGTPVRAAAAERLLEGTRLDDAEAVREAAADAAAGLEPPEDVHGSSAYRRRMAEVAVRRALHAAGAGAVDG